VLASFFRPRRGRLVRHYFLISVVLISGGLVEIYFRYQESWEHLALLQQEITTGAAFKIERFIQEIEHDLRAAAKSREITEKGLTPDYRLELRKLLTIARAITQAVAFDSGGVARAAVSRFGTILPLDKTVDRGSQAFQQARQGKSYFGPVYFVRGSEPYMTIAVPIERFAGEAIGVLQAEVNLKYVWESGLRPQGGQERLYLRRGAKRRSDRPPGDQSGVAASPRGASRSAQSRVRP